MLVPGASTVGCINIITDTATGKYSPLESTPRISSQDSDAQTLKHSRGAHEYRVHTDRICSGRT